MKRVVVGGAVLVLGLGTMGISFAGQDDNAGARKSQLVVATTDENTQCESSASDNLNDGSGAVSGFVILNAPGQPDAAQKVNGEVSLKDGLPNHTYLVYVADESGTCLPAGMLDTNDVGHGNSHVDMPDLTSGTYYVVLKDANKEAFASAPVTVR